MPRDETMVAVSAAQRGASKTLRLPIPILAAPAPALPKPAWIRVRAGQGETFQGVKQLLREQGLHTVCEEASCPNIGECFSSGTATFMIMGDLCTRRCPFCDVAHGRPAELDPQEPLKLARAVARLGLRHVVITSVDRDDLRDGGAAHFAACVRAVRAATPETLVETLVPDFRGRLEPALNALLATPPDVLNHNLETVPRLYRHARPGANYGHSLALLKAFKQRCPAVLTKSGLMLGLGETDDEVRATMADLRAHDVDMLTIGQYLQPRAGNLPVQRYVHPSTFDALAAHARHLGFRHAACAPMVRSSYRADRQAAAAEGDA